MTMNSTRAVTVRSKTKELAMSVRLAINGFGRTGRSFLRSALTLHPELEVLAINDLGAPEALARLFARDSVHGRYPDAVMVGDEMVVGTHRIKMLAEPSAKNLPSDELAIDVVAESTGKYTKRGRPPNTSKLERRASSSPPPPTIPTPPLSSGSTRICSTRRSTSSSRTHPVRRTASRRWQRCSTTPSDSKTAS